MLDAVYSSTRVHERAMHILHFFYFPPTTFIYHSSFGSSTMALTDLLKSFTRASALGVALYGCGGAGGDERRGCREGGEEMLHPPGELMINRKIPPYFKNNFFLN